MTKIALDLLTLSDKNVSTKFQKPENVIFIHFKAITYSTTGQVLK